MMQVEKSEANTTKTDNEKSKADISLNLLHYLEPYNMLKKRLLQTEKNLGNYNQFMDKHASLADRVKKLQEENAINMQNLNEKQKDVERLQEEIRQQIILTRILEESANDYNKQITDLKERDQNNTLNLKEKCLLIDSLRSESISLQSNNDILRTKNSELNDENNRLKNSIKDCEKENTDLQAKHEVLLSDNEKLKSDLEQSQSKATEDTQNLDPEVNSEQIETLNFTKSDRIVHDLELSSNSDKEPQDHSKTQKLSVMTNTKPWKCLHCADFEMEISYQKAIRNCAQVHRLLSPIPEELKKTLCSVAIQTDILEETTLPKKNDFKQDFENTSNTLKANTQTTEVNVIDGCPKNIINAFAILSELKRNRDKLLLSINSCGYRTTNTFNKLDLDSPNALPEVMKLMYNFLHDVTDSIQDSFEVITKQFNKSYVPQIGNKAGDDMPNDLNIMNSRKKRSYKEIMGPDNNKKRVGSSPNRKRKVRIEVSAKLGAVEMDNRITNNVKNNIEANEACKINLYAVNKHSEKVETMDRCLNDTEIAKRPDAITSHINSSPEAQILQPNADVQRMKRNLEIFSKAKAIKKFKNADLEINPIPQIDNVHIPNSSSKNKTKKTKCIKTPAPKLAKNKLSKKELFGSESGENSPTKRIKCKDEKIIENNVQSLITPHLQTHMNEISSNGLEINCDHNTIEKTNILTGPELILEKTIISFDTKDKVDTNSIIEEQFTSHKLIDDLNLTFGINKAIDEVLNSGLEIPSIDNLISDTSFCDFNWERNETNAVDEVSNSIINNENVAQNIINFNIDGEENSSSLEQKLTQKIYTNEDNDTNISLSEEKHTNSSINKELNEEPKSPTLEKVSTQKITPSECNDGTSSCTLSVEKTINSSINNETTSSNKIGLEFYEEQSSISLEQIIVQKINSNAIPNITTPCKLSEVNNANSSINNQNNYKPNINGLKFYEEQRSTTLEQNLAQKINSNEILSTAIPSPSAVENSTNSSRNNQNMHTSNINSFSFYGEHRSSTPLKQKLNSNEILNIATPSTSAEENSTNTSINNQNMHKPNISGFNFYDTTKQKNSSLNQVLTEQNVLDDSKTSAILVEEKVLNNSSNDKATKNGIESQNSGISNENWNKLNSGSSELSKISNKTSSIISNADAHLQSKMVEHMVDHQSIGEQNSYESIDKPICVLSGLLKKYVLVNRWQELTAQFPKLPHTNGKKFEMKIKQVKEILVPFLKISDMIPSLPDTIGKLQDLNMPDLSIITLECILYNMTSQWNDVFTVNKKCVAKLIGLLYHLGQIYNDFLDYTITAITYKIFRLKQEQDKDQFTLLYSQIYIGLCMKCHKYTTLNTFLVDCLYCLHYKCINILEQLLAASPNILQVYNPNLKENLLHTTMKYLIWAFKSSGEKLSTSPKLTKVRQTIFFVYKIPEDSKNVDGLLAKILTKANDAPDMEVYLSTILLARRESPSWVINKLINQGFLALLQSSWNEFVDSMLINTSEDKSSECHKQINYNSKLQTVKLCVDILGAVGRPLNEANKDKVISIIFLMKTMLASEVLDKIPELQETIITAMIQLSRHQYDAVADAIMLWKPKFLPSIRMVNKLKRFMHRANYRYWKNKLDHEYFLLNEAVSTDI